MKIKLAILDKDQSYLKRIVKAFGTKYADKFEIYSFSDEKIAIETLSKSKIDVLIASDSFDIDANNIPKHCGFAYLVDGSDVEMYNSKRAVCKFQRVDLIYKQLLSLYYETSGNVSKLSYGNDSAKVLIFSSPSGGAGASTMAASCAIHMANMKKRALYLNLELFGSTDPFFSAQGSFDMSDIIYAIKSKKANLAIKLESCVRQDASGVFFFPQAKVALDMVELTAEDILQLISEINITAAYDYVIIDMDFSVKKEIIKIYKQAHSIIWVGDGSEISNAKISRTFEALDIMQRDSETPLTNRICLVYNKFSSKTGKHVQNSAIKSIGGAPVYIHANPKQIISQIALTSAFDNIL